MATRYSEMTDRVLRGGAAGINVYGSGWSSVLVWCVILFVGRFLRFLSHWTLVDEWVCTGT